MGRDALVVGISRYRHMHDLDAPVRDAEAIAQALENSDNPFTVERLPLITDKKNDRLKTGKGTQVSRKVLRNALIQKFRPAGETYSDTVLFYFSGHGLYDPAEGKSYLAASDANPDDFEGCYGLRDLAELMRNSPIKQQIVWLDCCHSGEIVAVNQARPMDESGYSRCFVAASRPLEIAYERTKNESFSVLTDGLLRGLNPDNSELNLKAGAWIDTALLCAYLSQYFKVHGKTYPQRPLFSYIGDPVLLARKSSASLADSDDLPLRPDVPPYRALEAFDAKDAEFFFGRTVLTDALLAKVFDESFVAVLGPSGSGKSSVVQAGLLPELMKGERRDTKDWQVLPVIKPGDSPIYALIEAMTDALGFKAAEQFAKNLKASGAAALVAFVQASFAGTVVLVIDQFEEIFTLCRGETSDEQAQKDRERGQFLECLFGAVDALAGKLKLVVTMRADFLGKCLEREDLARRISAGRVDVTPLDEDEIAATIVKPAGRVGLTVADELRKRIVKETREQPGSLPLLEYALTETWAAWQKEYETDPQTPPELTEAHYAAADGLVGLLESQADKVYGQFAGDVVQQGLVQRIFLELVQPGVETEDTRRRVQKADLESEVHSAELVETVLSELVEARLVVRDENDVVDLAHEALIHHWGRLKGWLTKYRSSILKIRELEAHAKKWQDNECRPEYLLRGFAFLNEAIDILEKYKELDLFNKKSTCDFIEESRKAWISEEIEKESKILESLCVEADLYLSKYDQLRAISTIKNAVEQLKKLKRLKEQQPDIKLEQIERIIDKIRKILYDNIQEHQRSRSENSLIKHISYSPDQEHIAFISGGGIIKIWNTRNNDERELTKYSGSTLNSIAYNPCNGEYIATASDDGTVRVWDAQDGRQRYEFEDNTDSVNHIAYSSDGKYLASASDDGTVAIRNMNDGSLVHILDGHEHGVNSVAYSLDNRYIISADSGGTLKIWNAEDGSLFFEKEHAHNGAINSIACNPSKHQNHFASAGNDGAVKIWDLESLERLILEQLDLADIRNKDNKNILWNQSHSIENDQSTGIGSVVYSPDGKNIGFMGKNGVIKVLGISDLSSPTEQLLLKSYSCDPCMLAYSPDGKFLVSGDYVDANGIESYEIDSLEKTKNVNAIKIWHATERRLSKLLKHRSEENHLIAYVDSNKKESDDYASAINSKINIYDASRNEMREIETGQGTQEECHVKSIHYSPDRKFLVYIESSGIVKFLSIKDGKQILSLGAENKDTANCNSINAIDYSPDGKTVVSAGKDHKVMLWNNIESRKPKPVLLGEHDCAVDFVIYSLDGRVVASIDSQKIVKLWSTSPDGRCHPDGCRFPDCCCINFLLEKAENWSLQNL